MVGFVLSVQIGAVQIHSRLLSIFYCIFRLIIRNRLPCVKGAVERSETEGLSFATFTFKVVFSLLQLQYLRVCFANPPPFTQGRLFTLKLSA